MTHDPDLDLRPIAEELERRANTERFLAVPSALAEQLGVGVHVLGSTTVLACAGLPSPTFNRTLGFGIGAPPTPARLAQILDIYRSAGVTRYQLQLAWPDARADLTAMLEQAKLQLLGRWVRVGLRPGAPGPSVVPAGLEVAVPRSPMDVGSVVQQAIGAPSVVADWFGGIVGQPGWWPYVAFDDGVPVSTIAMFVHGDLAWGGLAATVPSHRGRGLQTAMLALVGREAARLGCRMILAECEEPPAGSKNAALDNCLRAGCQVLSSRRFTIASDSTRYCSSAGPCTTATSSSSSSCPVANASKISPTPTIPKRASSAARSAPMLAAP